jgi:hypothetical protein
MERYPAQLNIPQSQALVCVDTRDGLKSDAQGFRVEVPVNNPYDINIYKNQQIFSGAVSRIYMKEISMPFNIPNVNARNNVLYLQKSDLTQASITVPEGFYLPTELATAVQDLLNDTAGAGANAIFSYAGWVCSWDSKNNSFTISTYEIAPIANGPLFRVLPKLTAGQLPEGVGSTLAEMMGFNGVGTQFINAVIGSYASMLYTAYVDVQSDIICKNQMVRDTSTNYRTGNNILARIYICPDRRYSVTDTNVIGTRPFHLWEEFNSPKIIQWNTQEFLPSANIKLLDDKGMPLYSPALSSYIASDPAYDNDPVMYSGNTAWVNITLAVCESI